MVKALLIVGGGVFAVVSNVFMAFMILAPFILVIKFVF